MVSIKKALRNPENNYYVCRRCEKKVAQNDLQWKGGCKSCINYMEEYQRKIEEQRKKNELGPAGIMIFVMAFLLLCYFLYEIYFFDY